MEFVKKNIISIICGIVAIGAIVASFVPLGGMVQEVQAQLDKSAQTHKAMQEQLNKKRNLPLLDPSKTEAEELAIFPNDKQNQAGKEIVDKLKGQSTTMRDAAVDMNKHALLVATSLPLPPNQGIQFQFRDTYTALMTIPGPGQLPKLAASMRAGVPPTLDEVNRRKAEIQDRIAKEKVIYVGGQATPQSLQAANAEIADQQSKLPDQMRTAVAEKAAVYVNPDAFDVYPQINGTTAPDPVNIYAAQLMLWVQQDVINAINDCNKGSANVLAAPVKRLLKVQVQPVFVRSETIPASGDADAVIAKAPTVSATGRVSNPLFDVVHFTLNMDMDGTKVDKFLHDLSRNRLMNALNANVSTVDPAERLAQGFAYGNAPIVNVQLECEALFMRQWSVAFMPPAIKQSLGIQDPAAAPAEGQTPPPTASAQ
ncbi:MAG TPA: hypothetical protein VF669_05000 [Tepidisphaeraceae bacterium]|jgi:hypothetical protein